MAALKCAPHAEIRHGDRERGDRTVSTGLAPDEEMPRGQATASAALATRAVSGLPRGFPRTEAGAVEAGASFAGSVFVVQRMAAEDRWAYVRDAMLQPPTATELDAAAADFRARHRLTASGQLLDEDGEVSATTRFTSQCHPELGAYHVDSFTTPEGPPQPPLRDGRPPRRHPGPPRPGPPTPARS